MTFTYKDYINCHFVESEYSNGNIRLDIYGVCKEDGDYEQPISTVTVNVGKLSDGQVAIKDYNENEGMLKFLQGLGLIGEPVRFIKSGYVQIPICDFTKINYYPQEFISCDDCRTTTEIKRGQPFVCSKCGKEWEGD